MNQVMKPKQEMKLAENLERIMASKKLTVTSAAKRAGMNKSTLHGYLNGVVPRNLPQLKALADCLEVSLNELIFGLGSAPSSFSSDGNIEGRYEVIIRRVK